MARLLAILLVTLCVFAPARTRADIVVDIEGVDTEIRRNVLAFLSLERYRERDDLPEATLERLQERVDREVRSALRPFGYYQPHVRTALRRRNGDASVKISIDPGEPVRVATVDVQVTGPGADDPLFTAVAHNPRIAPGDRLSHAAYEKLKGDLQRTAATYGFLDARMTRSDLIVDPAQHTADIALAMETGERYRFGRTNFEQDVIDDSLAARYVRFGEGDPFDLGQLLRTQFALDDSQYFANVDVVPGTRDRQTLTVPVSIQAQANRRDRYSFGIGYGSDTRARGTATWDDRLVNSRGHRSHVQLTAAQLKQTLEGRYMVPIGDPALEKAELALEWRREEELGDVREARSVELRPSVTHVNGRWQRVLFTIATRSTSEFVDRTEVDTLLIPGISYALLPRGYLGEAIFSRTLYAELRGSSGFLGSDSDFVQLRARLERVFDLGERWHLLVRGDAGASAVGQFSQLPASQRFFAGGDQSVRGFGYNDLSPYALVPQTASPVAGQPPPPAIYAQQGGKHLFAATVEIIRDLPRNLGIAVFTDAGNAFDTFGDPLAWSAGIGLRLRLPVLTVGIDIAQALYEPLPPGISRDRSPRIHINFSPQL